MTDELPDFNELMAKKPTFEAMYTGFCDACGDVIEPGDVVYYDEDDILIHEDC